jgi:transcriptional regulator with XRE-family HTH domain
VKLPTGYQIKAARVLLGWDQRTLAANAKVTASTLNRMEARGDEPVSGLALNLQKVVDALHAAGVEFIPGGVRKAPKEPPR